MRRIALTIAALTALVAFATSACDTPATTQTGKSSKSSKSSKPSPSATPDPLAFTQCMRDQGIDMADPDPDTGRPKPGEGVDPQGAAYQKAMQDCEHLLPGSQADQSGEPKDLEKYQAFAECMRKNGMPDFPDPQPGEQGMFGNVGRSNPSFQKATEACQDVLAGVDQ